MSPHLRRRQGHHSKSTIAASFCLAATLSAAS
jgi:hypothetical protein